MQKRCGSADEGQVSSDVNDAAAAVYGSSIKLHLYCGLCRWAGTSGGPDMHSPTGYDPSGTWTGPDHPNGQ